MDWKDQLMHGGGSLVVMDVGTSGCRAEEYLADGTRLSTSAVYYEPIYSREGGFVEQDADAVFSAVVKSLVMLSAESSHAVNALFIGTALHSMLLVDDKGNPLTPLTTWLEERGQVGCSALAKKHLEGRWQTITGCPVSPTYPLYRLWWYRHQQPRLLARTGKILSLKSYLFFRLFGVFKEDETLAASTGMLDIMEREWHPPILKNLGIDSGQLPELAHWNECLREPLKIAGLERYSKISVAWLLGSGDGPLAHWGSCADRGEAISVSLGTSGAVRKLTQHIAVDPDPHIWYYPFGDGLMVKGIATNNAGSVLATWSRLLTGSFHSAQEIDQVVASARFDPCLLYLPKLYNERWWIPNENNSTAVLFGQRWRHGPGDILRAVIEGIGFLIYQMSMKIVGHCKEDFTYVLSGGMPGLKTVAAQLSSLSNSTVEVMQQNASTLGGARLVFGSSFCLKQARQAGFEPLFFHPQNCDGYSQKYRRWRSLSKDDTFHRTIDEHSNNIS